MAVATRVKCRVQAYAEAVVSGEVIAGKLVRLACGRHLQDLEMGRERGLQWDQEEADRAIAFFGHLKQSKGRWAGKPLELLDWQAFIIGSTFGWKWAATGFRRFRTSYTEIARKNGKSTKAAGVGLYLLDFDGEPGAEVYAAATKRDQAKIVWSEAASMVRKTPALKSRIKEVPSRANLHVLETASKFEALGADNDSLDGLNVHGAIIDELHAHKTRHVVDILETATAAREQPLFFYITTAGIARESIYQETHQYARKVVEGIVEDDGWFVYIATLDEDDDWTDPTAYIKANPSLGVTVQLEELVKERDRAMQIPGRQNTFRRLRLNQQTEQVNRWLSVEAWDACADDLDLEDYRGRTAFAALDLASTMDLNAAPLLFPNDDGTFDLIPAFFVPGDNILARVQRDRVPYDLWRDKGWLIATEGNITDYDVIREHIRAWADDHGIQIVELAYDRWNANQLITQLTNDGLTCVPFGQGFQSMAAPCRELEKVLAGKRLRHDGNPVMRWMVSNVAVEQDPAGNLKPNRAKSSEKIDGVVALLMALGRAMVSDGGTNEITGEAFWI